MQHQMDGAPTFERTEDAAGGNFQTLALNYYPSNVLPSKGSCSCFNQGSSESDICSCLASRRLRPSPASTWQLVTSESRFSPPNIPVLECSLSSPGLPSVSSQPLEFQSFGVLPSSSIPPSTTDIIDGSLPPSLAGLSSTSTLKDTLSPSQVVVDGPEAFFTARLGGSEEKRVQRLVNVAQGFSKAEKVSDILSKHLSGWSRMFRSKPEVDFEDEFMPETTFEAEVAYRLRRLEQARHKLNRRDWGNTRLWLVCLSHEMEYISQWEHIKGHTSRGVDPMSAAVKMATKYLDTARGDHKRSRNILQIMKEGGPASLLEDGGLTESKWEKFMTLDDITYVFAYRRDKLQFLDEEVRSHDSVVSSAMVEAFTTYGWSLSGLFDSNTKVMVTLKSYLQIERPYGDDGSGLCGSRYKRWRIDQSGASASLPGPGFLVNSNRNNFNQANSSRNVVESTPGSKNWTRDLIDSVTASNLVSAVNSPQEFTDPAMTGYLGHAVNSPNAFSDPVTARHLSHAVNSPNAFSEPVIASKLGHMINSSDADLAVTNFIQSVDKQSINTLSNVDYRTNQLIDSSVAELLRWTVNGPNELTNPSTERFLQGATSQLSLKNDSLCPSMTNTSSLWNASKLGYIDPQVMGNSTACDTSDRMDC